MSSPPRVSVEQSEFKKLKEEMGNLRGVKNESDFDWELSSGDEGYSNDDFELSTPKRETPGSSLKRTNTEELNDMFGGINLFPSSKSTNSELNNLSSDSSFMRDIENELQDALEDFSADRKEKLKSDVAVAEKGILKEQEEARTKRQRRKDSIELAAKTGRENLALLKDEKRKLTRENQRLTAALAAEPASATRQPTVRRASNIVANEDDIPSSFPQSLHRSSSITKSSENLYPQNNDKRRKEGPQSSIYSLQLPPQLGSKDYEIRMSQWKLKQLLQNSPRVSVPTPEQFEGKVPPSKIKSTEFCTTPTREAARAAQLMSFSINPDFVGNASRTNKNARIKLLRKRQAKYSHEVHDAFRMNNLSLADRMVKRLNNVNNELIRLSGRKAEVMTNIALSKMQQQSSNSVFREKLVRSNKPYVPSVKHLKLDSTPVDETKPYNWYEAAKAKSPLFQRKRPSTAPPSVHSSQPSQKRPYDLSWIQKVQSDSKEIIERMQEELRASRAMGVSGVEIIGGADYKRLIRNYSQSYEVVKSALDVYLEKEAERNFVPPHVVNEVQSMIRKTAEEMGVDWKMAMKNRPRPTSAIGSRSGSLRPCSATPSRKSLSKSLPSKTRPQTASVKYKPRHSLSSNRRPLSGGVVARNKAHTIAVLNSFSTSKMITHGKSEYGEQSQRPQSAVTKLRVRVEQARPQSAHSAKLHRQKLSIEI